MLKLGYPFTDHMVLQREKPICIYGQADAAGTVELDGQAVPFTPHDGTFRAYLPAFTAGGPYTLTVKVGGDTATCDDVLIGDVYIAAGQSNMDFSLKDSADIELYNEPNLRLFREPHDIDNEKNVHYREQKWLLFTPENEPAFTAIGYYFALELYRRTGVPVGIISCATGASRVDAWTAPEIVDTPEYQQWIEVKHHDYTLYAFNQDHLLYNNRLLNIVPYTVSGVLWYQGESNRCHEEGVYYGKMLTAMIDNWRHLWNDELPFYIVQLMPYGEGANADWAIIRRRQEEVTRQVAGTYLVTPVETGEYHEIHPTHKKTLARALANAVRNTRFGDVIEYCGPVAESVTADADGICIAFSHAGGLTVHGDRLTDTYVLDEAGEKHPANGTVKGNVLTLTFEGDFRPTAVMMGYANTPRHNLYNGNGYWASPFCKEL